MRNYREISELAGRVGFPVHGGALLPKRLGPGFTVKHPVSAARLSELLLWAARYSAEQQKLVDALRQLALTDELTGLYSRRGFMAVAGQQLKLARRLKRRVLMIFGDLDGLKAINDSFGHREGDAALKKVAKALRSTFRDSDVIARLGGDEFTVFGMVSEDCNEAAITARLNDNLKRANAAEVRYALRLTVGTARSPLERTTTLEELMRRADEALYAGKRKPLRLVPSV